MGEPYVHQIRGADNLIGPPFEILSDKAVKYYEKLKDKGENVYIDSLTYEGCGVCQCSKGCVDKDDTNPTIDKIAAADMILFATPVYWWGMSAQLKLIIDKCYCRGLQLKNKKKLARLL